MEDQLVTTLNLYNIYYKILYQKQQNFHLFDQINYDDESCTNEAMELLYDQLVKLRNEDNNRFTDVFSIESYRKLYPYDQSNYGTYIVKINNTKWITHNLISALHLVSQSDWSTGEWSINQVAEM